MHVCHANNIGKLYLIYGRVDDRCKSKNVPILFALMIGTIEQDISNRTLLCGCTFLHMYM